MADSIAALPSRRRAPRRLALVLVGGLAVAGLAAPATAVAAAPKAAATAAERLAGLRSVAIVAGSHDPVAVAAAQALDTLLQREAAPEGALALRRAELAALVGAKAKIAGSTLDAIWAETSEPRLVALFAALAQVGVPYKTYQSLPGVGFDCSGLTTFAWNVAGVTLARSSGPQIQKLPPVLYSNVKPADILWYPGHVSLSLGVGSAMVHSPYTGKTVEIKPTSRIVRIGAPVTP